MTKSNGIHKIIHQRSTLSNIIKTDKVQTYVQHSLSLTISERYNNVKLFPYGSYMYGAASMDSDLNIFLNFGKVNYSKICIVSCIRHFHFFLFKLNSLLKMKVV